MPSAKDKTVLVVDDEPNVREYLAQVLRDAGFVVLTAADGDQAMEIIQARKPDFISLDLVMPKKSGHKLLYELRKDKELSRIPVVIVTAHARDELGRGDLEDIMANRVISGPGIYLEKPVKPLDFVRCVQRALGIEETEDDVDRITLQEELQQQLPKAGPHALRRALEALKAKNLADS
ncbi:MAG: response regulator [Deltaproteobacteria bacterium]|nr:response regulator [Deltaproteobacteria bacterium]